MTPKEEVIALRVDGQVKEHLRVAAEAKGISLSRFILDAALNAAGKEQDLQDIFAATGKNGARKPSAHFRLLCEEAALGGKNSWVTVGFKLAYTTEDKELVGPIDTARMAILQHALESDDRETIWDWYLEEFPSHMLLVPAAKKHRFVDGVQGAFSHGAFEFSPKKKA